MISNIPSTQYSGPIEVFKIVTFGDAGVGKTTMRMRYIGDGFRKTYIPTMGVDFGIATYQNCILQIWDMAGQETFQSVTKTMYLGADGIIVVFDITNKTSMLNIMKWIDGFLEIEDSVVPMIVFGNKIDLRKDDSIQKAEAENYIEDLSKKYEIDIKYIETSALTGENIHLGFEKLVNKIIEFQKGNKNVMI